MEPGDFVDIHLPEGCQIGILISDEGETVTAELGTVFGKQIFYGIPKEIVTLFQKCKMNELTQ